MTIENLFNLKGKTALVTGASSGLGYRFSYILARAGAKVIVAARRIQLLKELAKKINDKGGQASPFALDISNNQQIKSSLKAILEEYGAVDILINNAGISKHNGIFDSSEDSSFEEILQTNIIGTWYITKTISNQMKEKGVAGSIINIASTSGANFFASGSAAYSISKAGIIQMTKVLVGDLAKHNIRINCIIPGWIKTPLTKHKLNTQLKVNEKKKLIPLDIIGKPADLDGILLYLASNKASRYVTGSCITIDGGASWGGVYYKSK